MRKTNRKYNCWFLNFTRSFFTHDIIGKFRKVFNRCVNRLSVLIRNGTIFGINSFEYSFFVLLFFMLLFFVLCLMRINKTEIYIANRSQ